MRPRVDAVIFRIDAHQHNWNPAPGDCHRMTPDDAILARPYAPNDPEPALRACGLQATVLIQAAATVCGSGHLPGIADATPGVAGVVGWMNFGAGTDRRTLERLAGYPKFVVFRPMIKDIPDGNRMLRDDVQRGHRAVEELNPAFDALGCPRHRASS